MKKNLFSLLLVLFVYSTNISANTNKIESIKITGLDTVSRGTVLAYLPIEIGDNLNIETLDLLKANLNSTNLFSYLKVGLENNVLEISVKENPTIKYFEIKGFKEDAVISENIVEQISKNYDLIAGKVLIKSNLDKALKDLKNLYISNAYFDTNISIKSHVDSLNRIGVEIIIDESSQYLINSLNILGNDKFSTEDLLDFFDMGPPDFFLINYFTENDHFSKGEYDSGIEKLKSFYLANGYLDFKLINQKIVNNNESKKIDINIEIYEGEQYKIGSIVFTGNLLGYTKESLLSFFDLKVGDIFERKKIVSSIDSIQREFQNKGYAFVSIDSSVKQIEQSNTLDLIVKIEPDNRIFINRIEISGNTRTQDDVIRRKLKILEGQQYTADFISESINSIKRLGFFSNVEYEILRHTKNSDKVDIKIEVTETKTGEFSVGLSHSNATGAALNAGVSQKNIFGTGNTLNASLSNSSAVDELSFYFKDPYFNNLGHTISYGLFDRSLDASNIDTASYTLDESGMNFGYGIPTSEFSTIFGEARASNINLTCGTELAGYEVNDCSSKDNLDFSFSLTYAHDTTNDYFFATDGSSSSIKSIIGVPIGDYKYIKLEASHKNYSPVFNDKVLKFASRLNIGSGYGGSDLPFYKRYHEGGSSSVRGFDFNSLGAKYSNDKPKGGELSFLTSVGIASPLNISGIEGKNIKVIGFIDAGGISEKVSSFEADDIRSSVGLQFTWLTPIGPIGMHLAEPIIKKSDDKTKTFSFELGSSF